MVVPQDLNLTPRYSIANTHCVFCYFDLEYYINVCQLSMKQSIMFYILKTTP